VVGGVQLIRVQTSSSRAEVPEGVEKETVGAICFASDESDETGITELMMPLADEVEKDFLTADVFGLSTDSR